MSPARNRPPSSLIVLERLEKELRRELKRRAGGDEVAVWLRFGALHTDEGHMRATFASRPQPHVIDALDPRSRETLATAMREAADLLDPRPQE